MSKEVFNLGLKEVKKPKIYITNQNSIRCRLVKQVYIEYGVKPLNYTQLALSPTRKYKENQSMEDPIG